MRPHSPAEAGAVLDTVGEWQDLFAGALGRRMVYAADEYYLIARRPFPPAARYDGFPQHENGIGMAAAFAAAFGGDASAAHGVRPGFFAAVDGAPAAGYRAPRSKGALVGGAAPAPGPGHQTVVVTGEYGAEVVGPLLAARSDDVRVLAVRNEFFGGNIAVTGLLAGADIARALDAVAPTTRVLLPDVCLSEGRFIDGTTLADLGRPVEVVATDGLSLRRALDADAPTGAIGAVAGSDVTSGPSVVPVVLGPRAS